MIDFRSLMLLRILTDAFIAAKGAQLTWEELDENQKALADTLARLEYNAVYGAIAYNPATAYTGGQTYYVSYSGNIWKFISGSTQTGITPGSNALVWELSSIGAYAHAHDTDFQLVSSGGIPVTADQILAWISGGGGGGGAYGIEPQTVILSATAITAPAAGFEKLVLLNVASLAPYTGLPAPTTSGKVYTLKANDTYDASFSVVVDGIPAGQVVVASGSTMRIVDLGTYIKIG